MEEVAARGERVRPPEAGAKDSRPMGVRRPNRPRGRYTHQTHIADAEVIDFSSLRVFLQRALSERSGESLRRESPARPAANSSEAEVEHRG